MINKLLEICEKQKVSITIRASRGVELAVDMASEESYPDNGPGRVSRIVASLYATKRALGMEEVLERELERLVRSINQQRIIKRQEQANESGGTDKAG